MPRASSVPAEGEGPLSGCSPTDSQQYTQIDGEICACLSSDTIYHIVLHETTPNAASQSSAFETGRGTKPEPSEPPVSCMSRQKRIAQIFSGKSTRNAAEIQPARNT